MRSLIRRIASAEGIDLEHAANAPETWWASKGYGEPQYDKILDALAPTDPDRRLLLRSFFDASPDRSGSADPALTHEVIADLAAHGRVKVIITTNFDRLMERALESVGLAPQVLTSPSHVAGMTPLVHAPVTVIKLHGDYASGALRNAPGELATYPAQWKRLLRQVFDEYGLLVVGWSAEWDVALRDAIAKSVGRRYAWYWSTFHKEVTDEAAWLVAQRGAHVIDTDGSDELFADLRGRVASLDRIAFRRGLPVEIAYSNAVPAYTPQGWNEMPLVVMRASAAFGATDSDIGRLFTEQRRTLVTATANSALSDLLVRITKSRVPVSASIGNVGQVSSRQHAAGWAVPGPTAGALGGPPRDVIQNSVNAIYRIGTDGTSGVSGLVRIALPQLEVGGQLRATIDVGLSISEGVTLGLLTEILALSISYVADDLQPLYTALLPREAEAGVFEVHWTAPGQYNSTNRPVPPTLGVDFGPLGPSTRSTAEAYGGYAERLQMPVSNRDTVAFVSRAMRMVATNSGFLEIPRGIINLP